MNIVLIDYGAGNVASVTNTLKKLGIQAELTSNPEKILAADKVIFPGVGEANHAMKQLHQKNLVNLIPSLKQPVLGICLGMQLMCKHSEERDTTALGIFDVEVKKFTVPEVVPHMGWNNIKTQHPLFKERNNDFYYFAHSYYIPLNEHTIARCDYEGEFSAMMQKDNFWACQFHPEKSAKAGALLLESFLNQ